MIKHGRVRGRSKTCNRVDRNLLNITIMKTRIFKTVLPALSLMLAVFGAFAFERADAGTLAHEFGWLEIPGNPCNVQVQCDNTPIGPLCTGVYLGTSYTAKGKSNPSVNICDKELRMPRP